MSNKLSFGPRLDLLSPGEQAVWAAQFVVTLQRRNAKLAVDDANQAVSQLRQAHAEHASDSTHPDWVYSMVARP